MLRLRSCLSAMDVTLLMYTGQGSSVVSLSSVASLGVRSLVLAAVEVRLRGVPMISRSIRRWVHCSLVVSALVVVQLAQPYNTVGVIVVLNRQMRACGE